MSIRWRLTLFNALAIGGILLLLGLTLFVLLRAALLASVEDTAESRATTAARTIAAGDTLTQEDVEQLTLDGVFVIVREGSGKVIYQSVNLDARRGASDGAWRRALDTGQPESGTTRLADGAPGYVFAVPVRPPGDPARVVEAGKSYESAQETLEILAVVLAAGIGAAFLLSIGGAYLLARAALKPVDAVARTAREITESDLCRRLPVANPKDEIGRLAATINGLLARLEVAFSRREEALVNQRRFTADASHELRSPLTAIRGHTRMLKGWALRDPEIAKGSVSAIDTESERMQSLVEALLTLARGDEGPPLDVGWHDLGEVAAEAIGNARAAGDEKVSIRYLTPGQKLESLFDRARVRQVASILLDNAVKYTPEGGSVAVRVETRDGRAALEVSDTGVGIPQDQLALVFERFHRADPSRTEGGVGLGLSIARQIAEAHEGEIRVTSTSGEGSTFTLFLPRKELKALQEPLPPESEGA